MYEITDDKLIKCRFNLAFHYYLVSYYTTCVQHSSNKIAKCEFTSLHWIRWFKIHMWPLEIVWTLFQNKGKLEIISKVCCHWNTCTTTIFNSSQLSLNLLAPQVAALIKADQDNQWIQRKRKSKLKQFTH